MEYSRENGLLHPNLWLDAITAEEFDDIMYHVTTYPMPSERIDRASGLTNYVIAKANGAKRIHSVAELTPKYGPQKPVTKEEIDMRMEKFVAQQEARAKARRERKGASVNRQ